MHRDERDHSIPAALSERPEFIAACLAHDMSVVFGLAEKYGLSRSAIARRTEIKTDHVREIINGRRVIESFAVYERISDGLRIPGEMLGLARRPWEQDVRSPTIPDTGEASSASLALAMGTTLVDMRRLETLRLSLHGTLSEGAMSATSLDDWEQTVLEYGYSTRDKPPSLMIYDLANDLDELNRALASCRTATAMTRLTRVTAHMAGLMVLGLVKLDDRGAFRRWARTARIAAAEAADPVTHAWVLMQEAYGHYYCDDYVMAAQVARHAQSVTSVPCVGTALSAALEARAYAAMGDHPATIRALARAEAILADLGSDSLISSAFGYSESSFRFHAGSAFTHLGDTASAAEAHDRALELIPSADYTDLAFVHIDRATCLAKDGDAGGAAAYLTEKLTVLTDEQRRGIISLRARDVIRALPVGEQSRPEVNNLIELLSIQNPETGV